MSELAVVVPVKSAGKSRLSPVLSAAERRAVSLSMFRGMMGALAGAGVIGACRVVSSDNEVLSEAAALGARPVPEPSDRGVNAAVRAAMDATPEADEFLVLPSDLPLLTAADVSALLRLKADGPDVVLSPSLSFDGTNALLFPRVPGLSLSFDSDSYWNHLSAAAASGLSVGVCARKGIMFDVDSPDDLKALADAKVENESAELARAAAR